MRTFPSWIRQHPFRSTCLLVALLALLTGGSILLVRALPAPSCGALALPVQGQAQYAVGDQSARVRQTEQCFVQAYQRCQAASLTVTWAGFDSGSRSTLTIGQQGATCQIIQSNQPYVSSGHSTQPATISTCQRLIQNRDTLVLLHCQGGNIVIPRGEECGTIISGGPADMNEQVAACFVQDERQCYPAEFSYIPPDTPPDVLGDIFSISSSCKLTMSIGYAQLRGNYVGPASPCTRMVQQRRGLLFQNCGSQGTILVPVNP